MTQILGTPVLDSGGEASYAITVPTGVTPDMVALFAFGSANGTVYASSMSAAAATFTQLDARAAGNMYVTVIKGTGLTAGQTITLNLTPGTPALYIDHYYQDEYDFVTPVTGAAVRSGSAVFTTSGSVTPSSGEPVVLVALDRTLAAATVSSVVSSGGETITQINYSETTANPAVSVYFGMFTASATASRTATITYSGGSGNGYAALLTTTAIVVPPPAGAAIHYVAAGGALTAGGAFYTSATDTLTAAVEVRAVPTGYATVAAMLAASPFYVAHRGGSVNWPEMSLHAYTQSVFWGVGALEISLARTSDGVWFGLHDATLDRTSGTTGFTASAHTWAEVQAYSITAAGTNNPSQAVQPYMRWEELMEAYYDTHVFFVDPKVALGFRTELLDMMDAMPGTPTDRFVAKHYGVVNNWPQEATARGYKGWGYFYQADVPNLPTYQGRWDILGMDYGADAASWTAVLSYGKPVIGHVTPSSGAATTALTYGADGLMVSGVTLAVPRTA